MNFKANYFPHLDGTCKSVWYVMDGLHGRQIQLGDGVPDLRGADSLVAFVYNVENASRSFFKFIGPVFQVLDQVGKHLKSQEK